MKIYTTGYTGKKPEDLKATVERLDAIVFDIRYVPASRWAPWWRMGNLNALLDWRYMWVQELGNRNYRNREGGIQIVDIERGVALFKGFRNRVVILMCGCKDYDTCHRKVVADALIARGHDVTELSSWK